MKAWQREWRIDFGAVRIHAAGSLAARMARIRP